MKTLTFHIDYSGTREEAEARLNQLKAALEAEGVRDITWHVYTGENPDTREQVRLFVHGYFALGEPFDDSTIDSWAARWDVKPETVEQAVRLAHERVSPHEADDPCAVCDVLEARRSKRRTMTASEWIAQGKPDAQIVPVDMMRLPVRGCTIRCKVHPEWGTWGVYEDHGAYYDIHSNAGDRVLFKDEAVNDWEVV